MIHREQVLLSRIDSLRSALLGHSIYGAVNDLRSLRVFMESHVFAVLDFMSLTKVLQRDLTCIDVPWIPPKHSNAARFINSIVLGEETDEIEPGRFVSHFDLYLEAMGEVGADRVAIVTFIEALRRGVGWRQSLEVSGAPLPAIAFVRDTLMTATTRKTHEIAAAFLFGREDLVPLMFQRLLGEIEASGLRCPSFKLYLQRHIDVDTNEHGPLARRLLGDLCGDDEALWNDAATSAAAALRSRLTLWNCVESLVRSRSEVSSMRVGEHAPPADPDVTGRWTIRNEG